MSKALSPFTLGVGFTALLALVPGLGLGSSSAKPPVPAARAAEARKSPGEAGVGALVEQCLRDRARAGIAPVEATILTLPDPQRTNMGLWFDLRLNAAQRAFRTFDFLPRSFYLPWGTASKEERESGASSAFPEPGLGFIWFAREGAAPAYHALFIVGESQALGVNREALRQALQLAAKVVPAGAERRISILGPQFSGSLTSLGAGLEAHFKEPSPLAVRIQGTTTLDASGTRLLREALGPVEPRRLEISTWTCNLSGTAKESLLSWYMGEAGWPRDASKVALFTEANTAYRRQAKPGEAMTQILFPMGLSRLRTERQAMERSLGKEGGAELVLPSSLLGPAQEEAQRVLDTAPQYSPDTIRNTELTLAGTILSLARRGYTHVGISASDPQDLMFLAERIRAYHPSCTLFTTSGNHSLFAHPNVSQAMDGMVMFGGYPVTDSVRALSLQKGELESPVRFTSEGEYATYYATLLLLDPARAKDPERILWGRQGYVSIVKGGSVWPLRHGGLEVAGGDRPVWDHDVEARYREVATQSKDLVQYVHSRLRQLVVLLAGLGLATALAFLGPLLGVARVPSHEPGLDPYRNLVVGAVLALGILSFLAMGYVLPLAVLRGSPWRDPFLWMSLAVWAALLWLTFWALAGRLGAARALLLWGLALVPAALMTLWGPRHFLDYMPDYLRFSSPGRGVSMLPAMVILAAGLALLLRTWFAVRRQGYAAFWPAPLGLDDPQVLSLRHLRGLQFQPWTFGLVAVLAGFQWFLPGGVIRPLMEGPGATLAVVAAASGLFTASLFLFWQFHRGWQDLRRVLEALDFCPYRAAFAEVGRLVEWNAMRALGRGLWMHRSSLRGREILKAQRDWVVEVEPGFATHLEALDAIEAGTSKARRGLGEYEKWRVRLAVAREMTACGDALALACAKLPAGATATAHPEVDLFKALRAVHFIRQAFLVLRHLLMGSVGTLVLLVLGVAAFDFQPKNDVLILLCVALLAMAAWAGMAILNMERDPLLSLMEGTQAGEVKLSLGLVENGLRFVLVPLLLLLATLNPSFGGLLVQVFNPLMHLLK